MADDAVEPGPAPTGSGLGGFLAGTGSWYGAFGLHGVLFAFLLVVVLEESEVWVGVAQSAVMLPAVLLILVGGAVADRHDRRRLMMLIHGVGALTSLGLGVVVYAGGLSYGAVITYALCLGTAQAFGNPARDALLSAVVRGEMGQAVASMTRIQWGAQAVGAFAGGLARSLGVVAGLWGQALVFTAGIFAFARLPPAEPPANRQPLRVRDMTSGVLEVWASPVLLPCLLLVCAVGVMFIGPFMVVLPLMVRDVYGGGVGEISLVSTAFPVGTIAGATALVRRGGVRRKGPAQLFALLAAATLLLVISTGLPFFGTLGCVVMWGGCASVFMIAGRTLFQQYASEAHRARVLSTYTLGFMGAAGLLGAPVSGVLVSEVGPLLALRVLGLSMFAVVGAVAFFSGIAKVD